MPFARVGQRGRSHGKSHAGTLRPCPSGPAGSGHAPSSLERYTAGSKFIKENNRLNRIFGISLWLCGISILTGCISSSSGSNSMDGVYMSEILDFNQTPINEGSGTRYIFVFHSDTMKYYRCQYSITTNSISKKIDTSRILFGEAGLYSIESNALKASIKLNGRVDSLPTGNFDLNYLKFSKSDIQATFYSAMKKDGSLIKLDIYQTKWSKPVIISKRSSGIIE
jgi:hypothetical protein